MVYDFSQMSDEELERELRMARGGGGVPETEAERPASPYMEIARQELPAEEIRKQQEAFVEDRSSRESQMKEQLRYVIDNTKEEKEREQAAKWLASLETDNTLNWDDESMARAEANVGGLHRAVADRRGHFEKFVDSLVRGHNQNATAIASAADFLSGDPNEKERSQLLRAYRSVGEQYDAANPRGSKSGTFSDAVENGAGAVLDYVLESAGENAERMAIGTAAAMLGGAAGGAAGAMAGSGVGSLALNAGEAAMNQIEDSVKEGLPLSRGWLAAEAGMYSAIEGAFGIEAGMGKVAVKMGLRKAAGDAAIEGLKAAGKMATAKGAAKTALKGALGEGVEEVLQDAGADRVRLWGQTGSPLRKAETVEDAFKQAGESFAGGFAAAILTGGVGAAANHANARRVVGIHNRVVDAVAGDSAFKELAPDKQLLVARRLMNDSMLATDGVIDAEYRSLLERQNEAIDAELGKEDADGETRAANAVLRGFDLAFAKEDMASVVEDMKANGSYKKRADFKAMHDSRKDIGELPDGKTTGILYTDPATKQALVERHDKKTGRIVDFVVVNNGGLKDSLTGGDALHTRSLDKALAAMDDLANYNAYRAKKSEAKREVVKRMFDRLYGKRGAKLVVADSLASLKDSAVRDKFAVEMEKSGLPPVAAYDDKTDAVYVLADQIKNIGQLYTVLAHERAHKDIADAILGKPVEQGGATDEEHEAIAAGRERLFGSMRGGAERGEEDVVERASVDAIVKALDRSNRSAVDAAVRKALDLIRWKINEETGIALDAIADTDAKNELRFLVKQGYLGKEAEVQLEAQEDTEAERMADQFAVESGLMTEDERKRREAEREAVAVKARGKAERKAAGEEAARVIAEDGANETVPPITAAQEERIAARKEDFEAALEDAESKTTQTTGENDETGNGADEAPAQQGVGSGEAAQRTAGEAPQTGAQRAQGTESAGVVERQTAQNAASANAEAPGARPAAETDKTTPAAPEGVETPSRASGAQGAKPAAKRKPRQKQNFKNFSITAYDEDARSGSNGLLRIARGRGGIWRIPVDMSRTTPGGKVHFTNDDADVTDYIKSLLADYGGLYMSKAGKLYLKNNKGGKGRMPSELRYLFGETFKPGHNDNYIAETLAEELGYVPENLEPSDLYSMLDKDLRNYKAWRQAKARGEAWETEDERAEREHYEAAEAEEDAYYLDQAEMKAEADAEYDNALAEVLEYDGTPTVRMFGKSQMKSLKGGETIYFDHDGIDWVVVGYDAKNDILTVKEPQEVAESRVWAEGGDTTRATPKMIKYAVTEDGFSKIGESEEKDGRETQGESYQDGDGDAAGAARGAQAGGRQGTGGTEQGTFALESAAADEIKREEKSRAAKAQMEKKASAPLKGSAGEVGQSLLDLGGEEGEDLFNRTASTEAKKAEATQSEELPQGIERRANGYAVRGNVYRSVAAAQKALEKERAVFRQGDTVTLKQDGETVTGTVNRAPDGSLSVRVREPGRNRYEPAKVRDVKVKDRKNLTKLIDGGTRWKRANVADFDKANGTELSSVVSLAQAMRANDEGAISGFRGRHFRFAKTNDTLRGVGLSGDYFTIRAGVILRHNGKDAAHDIMPDEWADIADALTNKKPEIVEKFGERIGQYRIWTQATIAGKTAIVGAEVKNVGKDIEVNAVQTVFGAGGAVAKEENVVYPKSTEEIRSVLTRHNSGRYTESPQDGNSVSQTAAGSQGGAKTMFKRSGIYTGTAADYANRSRQGGVDDGPSLKKIGTGEGSQVYGWGLIGTTIRKNAERDSFGKRQNNLYKQTFFTNRAPGDESHLLDWNGTTTLEQKQWFADEANKEFGGNWIVTEHGLREGDGPWFDDNKGWKLYNIAKMLVARNKYAAGRVEQLASEFLARAGIDGVKAPDIRYGKTSDKDELGNIYVSFRDDNIRVDHKWTDGVMRFKRNAAFEHSLDALQSIADGADYGVLHNAKYGEIRYPKGRGGKGGMGFLHIVQSRMDKDGARLDEAIDTAIRVGQAVEIGEETAERLNTRHFDYDGVRAIVAWREDDKAVITGYEINEGDSVAAVRRAGELAPRPHVSSEEVAHRLGDIISNLRAESKGGMRFKRATPDEMQRVVEHFGTTRNLNEAGYILPDGRLLDLSGRREGARGGSRTLDHRDVWDVLDDRDNGGDAMMDFMLGGAVRIMPESGGISLTVRPTDAQLDALERFVIHNDGEAEIDFMRPHGDSGVSVSYETGTRPSRILNEIKRYFDEGVEPRGTGEQYDGSVRFKRSAADLQRDYDEVVRRYTNADGTKKRGWMRAPNGKPTRLTEHQWVQVRTPAFKEWFGDWEKNANIAKLKDAKDIEFKWKNQFPLDGKSARRWLLDNIRGEYENRDTGDTIHVVRDGVRKVTSHSLHSEAHLKSTAAIPQIIRDSVFITELDAEKDGANYDKYRYYVAGIEIDGVPYTVKMVVGLKGRDQYYDHDLTQIRKGNLLEALSRVTNPEDPTSSLDTAYDTKLLTILQPAESSHVVDENGEPMVVWHSTDADFTVFDRSKLGSVTDVNATEGAARQMARLGFWFNQTDLHEQTVQKQSMPVYLNIRNSYKTTFDELWSELSSKTASEFLAELELKEYDGIALDDSEFGGTSYIALNPNQVKSATDNTGAFSRDDNDIRFKRASADGTDYYFGAKESFAAHGRETYTAKDLGISTTDEAVLAAAHRYARDFRRVKQLMDDAILGRERTYTPVDVAALTVKHRDLQHDLADVLRRMESTGNPDEFQAEKELIEAQLDNVARASSIIGTKTGQTLRAFRIGISDDIRDSEAYILQSMRVNKQRKGLGSELTDEEVAKAKQMVEQLKAENEKLKAQIAELEKNRKNNLKTQVEATDRPKRTAARKAAKTLSTEQRKKDFAKKYGHSVSDSGAKAWNLLARLSGKTTAMFKGGKGAALTPDMMDAFAQIVEDMDGDYEVAASAIKDTLPDMAGAFAQFRSSMEKRDKSDLSTLADNFRKVVVPKHGLAELAQPITDQRLVTTKDLEGAREECKRQLDENEGNPREQRIALSHYLRRYRDALINENPDIPQDELNEKMAAEATALTGTKHDAMAMLAVEAGVDGYDLQTRAEIQRKIAKAQRALDLFRAGKINEAARESGLLYEDEATALAEMEATLQQLMQEKADEIDYLGTFSEKNKEAVERVKQLKSELEDMRKALEQMKKSGEVSEVREMYAEVLSQVLKQVRKNANIILGGIDDDKAVLKRIEKQIAELETRIADGDYDRQPLQIRANDAELQAKIRMQRERRNALRRKLDEERRRMSYREMGVVGKTWEGVKGILGEMKSVVASFDLSSVLRQGGQLTWAHPFIAAKNLKETLKAFKSEGYADKLMAQLRMRPNWQYYEKAGIDFTDWGEGAQNKEDVYLLNQYRKITNMKLIKSGVQMSERAFSTFLNLMRADVFDAMAAGSTFGGAANMNDSQLKAMGRFINIASQRGAFEKGGKVANAIPFLNMFLWSPRNVASRFQFLGESARLLAGGAAYGDKTMRKVFAKELVRYVGGMSAAAMFLKAMAELFRDDDDPPNDMEFDPRSSDFLKVRFGNIRIDMTSGLTPIIVFASRMLSGETKNLRGQVRESNRYELVGRFMRQKFAPGASLVYDMGIAREDFERRDIDWTSLWVKDAEHVSAYRYLFGSFMPLTGADLLEQAQVGGLPKTFVTGFLSTLGANVQAFDPYNFKQMKGDYTYFRGLYDKATDPEEKRHLLEYHPMLKRCDRIEAALKRVRDLDKIRKNAEKSGQSRPDLDERIKEAKQKAVDAIAGF